MRFVLSALVLSASLAACAPKATVIPTGRYVERAPNSNVELYLSPGAVKRSYSEIALVSVDDQGWETDDAELFELLKRKAGEIGADAVILLNQSAQSDGGAFVNGMFIQGTKTILRGAAIVFE